MTARRHHYVPQCYLKAFAIQRKKTFQTTIFDARVRKQYPTSIKNVAVELDFNRIDAEGYEPDAIERTMSQFESELAPALERVLGTGSLADRDDCNIILNFMCLLALRNPRYRESVRTFHEQVSKQIMSLTLATPERYASQMREAIEAGAVHAPAVPYEQMRKFIKERRYTFSLSTTYHMGLEFKTFDKLLETFIKRRWVLLRAPSQSGGFITSDHPLCLMWSDPEMRKGFHPPGHGLRETEVIFPLSPQYALVGAYELQEGELDINESYVAYVNGIVAWSAEWQVYARNANFMFIGGDGTTPRKASRLIDDSVFKRPYSDDDSRDG